MKFSSLPHSTKQTAANFTELRSQFVQLMVQYAPILQYLEFFQFSGDAARAKKNSSASGGTTRPAGSDYPDNRPVPTYADLLPVVFGDTVMTDAIYEQASASDGSINSQRVDDILAFIPDFAAKFQYALFNYAAASGTAENPQWDGIKTLIPGTRKQAVSLQINTEALARQLVYEFIMPAAAEIGNVSCMIMDIILLARLSEFKSANVSYGTSVYGQIMPSINGIPVVIGGLNGQADDAAKTMPFASGTTTSIILMACGEKRDVTVATWCGYDFSNLGKVKTHWDMLVEGGFAPGILRPRAIKELNTITW
jgi:hypothetical protein